ncbi:SCO4225 family membrane protein [Streptomyces sp. NBC_01497]|uniref:SCO4225 family membrane protein n=1 Tax=Streptomyces sp. NBC_01497 TaxID=2903885 RepID=UPI002E328D24|nr:hypothetical protein [Streptomyces sp. NBC_01497]
MAARPRSFTTSFRRALLHPVSLAYLALVAGVWCWVACDLLFVTHQDATLSGVWAFLVTAPTSLLFVALPGPLPWAGLAVGAVLQAAALGAAAGHSGFTLRLRAGRTGRAGR